ncbi:MAG: ornithine cyclodeaminase family protein [Candidatus Tectomicrobia bacterium]|uniref:Ornithine cyclodeaminase family protein n=1 Tax=Tectimicrobiota bacterium TaxID=2528274 RepID=A0A932HWM2_UNCTE|nr:ornithine cyclodeaminase family protein [Candidatus Tectomicrobia bacterium]
MLYLNEKEIESLVTMPDVMEAVDKCFRLQGEGLAPNQPRRRIFMPKGTLHAMSGGLVDGGESYLGVKAYTTFPGLGTRFIFILWDANSAELLSFMEANIQGQLRTGAASGVAAKYMAREDASEAGLFGTGWQARTQLEALCCARPLKKVKIYSRSPEKREKFIATMQPRVKARLVAVSSPAEAVRGSQIVCTMTNAKDPVFDGKDLEPGTTVIAAGSNRAANREVDEETFRRAAKGRIATDNIEGSRFESGDLIAAVGANAVQWGQVVEIGLIASGRMPGRASRDEINLFLSQGIAIEDVALGALLYKRAKERGVGTKLPVEGVFKKAT